MVGRLKTSKGAENARQLFMALEKKAKKIKTCWFCGFPVESLKLANQGMLTGNHRADCPFERLAAAAQDCIAYRHEANPEREVLLAERSKEFSAAMKTVSKCPLCESDIVLGHEYGCGLKPF
jgi:hypothetical protein